MYLHETLFKKFLSEKEITWMGIDFSKAKLTKHGFDISIDMLHRHFNEWNMLIISDQKKYDIRMAFRKPIMHYDLYTLTRKNNATKLNQFLVDHLKIENQYSEEAIREYACKIELSKQSDFVLMVIVESFDQNSKVASLWVVILHVPTKEVVLCEKFLKVPSGFGTRSFWARVFYNLFFDIRKSSFLRWINLVESNHLIK